MDIQMKHFLLPNRLDRRPPMGQQTMAQAMWREAVTEELKMIRKIARSSSFVI